MNPHPSALLAAIVMALAAGCASTPPSPAPRAGSPPAHATPPGPEPRTAAVARGPEAALEKGMTAETVRRVMGRAPAEILPMKTAAGNAEVWVYRRTSQGSVRQVQVGTRSIPIAWTTGTDGRQRVLQSIDEPILRMQYEILDETIHLLMFGGQFLEQKRSIQTRFAFQ